MIVERTLGQEGSPFFVNSLEDLQKIGTGVDGWNMDSHYYQTSDIDIGSSYILPIGYQEGSPNSFTGIYDGNGYTISGLGFEANNYVGLFARINGGTVRFVNLDINKSQGKDYVGTIAGWVTTGSSIHRCNVKSNIIVGEDYVGGIAGLSISMIYFCSVITANPEHANPSYHGYVEGTNYIGGIVGWSSSSVATCYYIGRILDDGQATEKHPISNGGSRNSCLHANTGFVGDNSIEEMQNINTFSNVHFSIADINNYTDQIWVIDNGNDFPYIYRDSIGFITLKSLEHARDKIKLTWTLKEVE